MEGFLKGVNWIVVIGVLATIDQQIGNGSMSIAHTFPLDWQPAIKETMGNLGSILTAIMTAGAFGRVPASSIPLPNAVKQVVLVALMAGAALILLAGSAQAQTPRPRPGATMTQPQIDIIQKMKDDFSAKTGVQATGDLPFDLLKALDAKLLPDLQYALKLAQATGSNVTAPCYQAWIDMINTQQTAVQTKNADGTTSDIPVPDPHLVTDFERMVELRNALQPESTFMTKCSPVANMIKQDVVSFMGKVISGGAGIAALVPGL
jgi:hypothetical protein